MRRVAALGALLAAVSLCACGGSHDGKLALALNWKPEPEFGGLYEALRTGAFASRGLPVEVTGGPGAPVVQMVESGQVAFGVAAADEVVLARDRGTDVVAVFATYQTNPQGIMVHAARKLSSLADLFAAGGTLAVEPGLPYVKWLEKRFDLSRMKIVPYGYSIAPFLLDPMLAQQVFITAEPIQARRQGADPQVFLIADSGFDPYAAVYITSGKQLREEPARVAAFAAALRDGWRGYLDDPAPANAKMGELNREMDAETFRLAAAAQQPLVETDFAKQHGLGAMSLDRWSELGRQLRELGLVDHEPDAASCFADTGALAGGASRP
ncbi:MAG TPA: ABC transporter substrate-binding protein [Myxococcota bacterium]|nr:ABC transporter substrate-binding protein [Myxococcota bacterium]